MFLRPEVKSKIDSLWNKFWSGGIANPLDAIGQITALIFLKLLSERDNKHILEASFLGTDYASIFAENKLANWDEFKQLDSASMLETLRDVAFPFIKSVSELNTLKKLLGA